MNILIAGGTGFLGRYLTQTLVAAHHHVWILSRTPQRASFPAEVQVVGWDGRTDAGWGHLVNEMDAIVNLSGKSLASWPWTASTKQAFWDSRLQPGRALVSAIQKATRRPRVFLQASGINHYGLRGDPADESTPPADDFLARLTVAWEASTRPVEEMGVRRVVLHSAVVLAAHGGLLPLMALPVRLFLGGPLGGGQQAMPWIHVDDEIGAMRFLLENEQASGPFNLIAPHATSSAEFFRILARTLHRPYWFPTPAFLLRLILGEMSNLILEGRFAQPKRLLELGYSFKFSRLEDALANLFRR